jgi:hypothetical protein
VYQQYDIKKLNGEMAFSSTAMWWRIFRMVFKAKEKLCQRELDSVKMRFATFPQNGERCHCRMDQQCRFLRCRGSTMGTAGNAASIISF